MDEDDVMIVLGDHGMHISGNHGGSSDEETHTSIFGYSKRGFSNSYPRIKNFDPSYKSEVNQIDILPTISMLLGTPIPFNNLGTIIPDFYPPGTSLQIISHVLLFMIILKLTF